eukprot:741719-Rhodomonas_salina.1
MAQLGLLACLAYATESSQSSNTLTPSVPSSGRSRQQLAKHVQPSRVGAQELYANGRKRTHDPSLTEDSVIRTKKMGKRHRSPDAGDTGAAPQSRREATKQEPQSKLQQAQTLSKKKGAREGEGPAGLVRRVLRSRERLGMDSFVAPEEQPPQTDVWG